MKIYRCVERYQLTPQTLIKQGLTPKSSCFKKERKKLCHGINSELEAKHMVLQFADLFPVSYTHLTLPTNREV